jgi:hypothetical protein
MKRIILSSLLFALTCSLPFINVKTLTAETALSESKRPGEQASIRANSRGNPRINFSDGFALSGIYTGPHESRLSLQKGEAAPRSLASADFDEDGTSDLVCGYAGREPSGSGGIIALYRGNEDSIYPYSLEAEQRKASGNFTDSAFLSPARVFAAGPPVDFVEAGDFDADGHWDIVTAARGSAALYLLAGDGRGNLEPARQIDLPGVVTALEAGEINRPDGLADIVVGVAAKDGAKALVFEGPGGALKSDPEILSLPIEAAALVLGQFDSDYNLDVAVGAGSELLIFRGRDRRLSLDRAKQMEVPAATVDRHVFSFAINSIAIGHFTNDSQTDLGLLSSEGAIYLLSAARLQSKNDALAIGKWPGATNLICARVSAGPADDLLIMDAVNKQVHILTGENTSAHALRATSRQKAHSSTKHEESMQVAASLDVAGNPVAVLPMRLNADALNDLVMLYEGGSAPVVVKTAASKIFTVNTTDCNNDFVCDGHCTLFDAISEANANPGADLITFNIPGPGPHVICQNISLFVSDPVTIDGTSQPGYAGVPLIKLFGQGLGDSTIGLTVTGGNSTVRGLLISLFNQGIQLSSLPGDILEANYVGVEGNPDLTGNFVDGISVLAPNSRIGGTSPKARNIISGNRRNGIRVFGSNPTGNLIQGNYIGTDNKGTAALGNQTGISLEIGRNNIVGGTEPGAGNLISGNGQGINISGIAGTGNLIQGNFIGTDRTGRLSLGNRFAGISIVSPGTTVGGTSERARNIISGNGAVGVQIFFGEENLIQGNFIGTDVDGVSRVPNAEEGVLIDVASNNTVGGAVAGARNTISGNASSGVFIFGTNSSANRVQGNYIGTDVTGILRLFNEGSGVEVTRATDTLIGGLSAEARNVISGNLGYGIFVSAKRTVVQGNFIGTDRTGLQALSNLFGGVNICCGASDFEVSENLIGGTTVEARNVISGNGGNGVGISGVLRRVARNTVQGNFIGTDHTGTAAIPNRGGIAISESDQNIIGGATSGAGNVISGNSGDGILITGFPIGNLVQGNFIGTDLTGSLELGNSGSGVVLDEAFSSAIGGATPAARNVIAFNGSQGVVLYEGDPVLNNNAIRGNSIFSNNGLGIDLSRSFNSPDGVTPNDPCDGDIGANDLQNYPVLISAVSGVNLTTIQGTLNSTANKTFTLEFFSNAACDSSGFGEGKTFIGSAIVTTDANCNAAFSAAFAVAVPGGQFITATATDPTGNTSEFSQCVQVTVAFDLCIQDESSGNLLLVSTTTGEYRFNNCRGLTVSGRGMISIRGCSITLQHNAPDRRLLASIDTCAKTGTASLQLLSQGTRLSITDRNTANNTCACAQ